MSEPKRIVFTTEAPNDQGGVIPNNTLDFERYNLNPVILAQHVWGALPIGLMSDIKYDGAANGGKGEWSGVPRFNRITQESRDYADMYEGGWIKASSIGGDAEWKTNTAGQLVYDAEGNKVCEKFILYEISIVTLPSNHQAVTKESYATKIYSKDEIQNVHTTIVTLSTKYKQMETTATDKNKKTPEQLRLEAAQKELADAQAAHEAAKLGANGGAGASSTDPSIGQLPAVVSEIVKNNASATERILNFFGTTIKEIVNAAFVKNESAPAPKGEPESKISDSTTPQPTPTGLTAEQADKKKKAEECRQAAEEACRQAATAKEKAEKEGASQEDKDDYAAKFAHAEKCVNDALEADDAYKSCMNEATHNSAGAAATTTTRTTNAAGGQNQAQTTTATTQTPAPKIKTVEELAAEQKKLAPKPEHRAKVVKFAGVPFTQLTAKDNEEGQRLLGRVMTQNGGEKEISDYQILLESLLIDDKYKAIGEKTRIITTTASGFPDFVKHNTAQDLKKRNGMNLHALAARLQRGSVEVMGDDGVLRETMALSSKALRETVKLTSTDNLLASPDLYTVEWLTLAIFTLYPSNDWKSDIPMFGAEMTSKNTGLIWANVAADPAIYFGTQPVSPADYSVDDEAVALTLISSWLQPMVWTPLTMHQLRYDKMAVQWAQAFAKWGAAIDDKLIYTLAAAIPIANGSIVSTVGQTGQGGVSNFTLTGVNDPNAFYYNPTLTGQYAAPAWADIIRQEQIYSKQNFDLDRERMVLITDPTMDRYISTDPDTKSLLTRFTVSNPEEVLKIKHTKLIGRSRVAAYDPVSGQVKDPSGALPGTTVSAGVGFIPSQVGMGLGILDVFMIQDPSVYGYRMSADIREGIQLLRQNGYGSLLYTYGGPVNA